MIRTEWSGDSEKNVIDYHAPDNTPALCGDRVHLASRKR